MTRTELVVQLLKVAIGLAFGAYFVWWSLEVLDRLTPEYDAPTAAVGRASMKVPGAGPYAGSTGRAPAVRGGRATRNVQARPLHVGSLERAGSPSRAPSTIAQNARRVVGGIEEPISVIARALAQSKIAVEAMSWWATKPTTAIAPGWCHARTYSDYQWSIF
jgi:hypothetical protein